MALNRYHLSIFLQLVLLGLTSFTFIWTLSQEYMLVTSSSLVLVWIGQIFYLFHFMNRIRRDMQRFVDAFKNHDTSLMFKITKGDKYFTKLYTSFNEIIKDFKLIRIEKEVEHQFFQNTISHVGTGLFAFDREGDIKLLNQAALDLLNMEKLNNILGLDLVYSGLSDKLTALKNGQQQFVKLMVDGEFKHFSIKASDFKLDKDAIKLIAIQDITREIDKSEVEAWQKLIRVLTHEIMNSVSPINLLSGSLITMFEEGEKPKPIEELNESVIENALLGLHTIRKRSNGLSSFVETYRSLTKIPDPNFKQISLNDLLKRTEKLFEQEFKNKSIGFSFEFCEDEDEITADEKLIEQVLINLIKNAIQAVAEKDKSEIIVRAIKDNHLTRISVEDNGSGIGKDILENIFVPFYTTKEQGTGIGLSLSRQIMQLHNGSIKVQSTEGKGSVFTLSF